MGVSALALEISLGAAMIANEFARAYLQFGPKRKRYKSNAKG